MSAPKVLGLSVDSTTYKFLLLLASSPSRSVPALIFVRPFLILLDAKLNDPELEKFRQLFRIANDKGGPYGKTSIYDFQYGLIELGPELEVLQRKTHLEITYQEKVTFLEISPQLRQYVWNIFAIEPEEYRKARTMFCLLILFSLPIPYTEPLWEMTSFVCKDVISTTLIPFLFTTASHGFSSDLIPEQKYSLLIFHLTNLGFVLDDTHWHLLFNTPISSELRSFFEIHKQMSHLLNIPSSDLDIQRKQDPEEFRFPHDSLCISLVGFTISQITWKSPIPESWKFYESWRSWWSANSPPQKTSLEGIAHAILYPEEINVVDLTSRLPPQLICALAVGLRCSGHLETSSNLLDLSLTFDNSEMYSHVYGLLFAELVKLSILLDKAQKALVLALTYLQETGTNNVYVSIAKADAYIALGEYDKAHELLRRIISDPSTEPFEKVCSILRLNKAWRRTPNMGEHWRLTHNLEPAIGLIKGQGSQIQEEYMIELQATVYHVKKSESSISSDLNKLIKDTLNLYKEDDATLQKQRSNLRTVIETTDTDIRASGLEQDYQIYTEPHQRELYHSLSATNNSTYPDRDRNINAQTGANSEKEFRRERDYSDPFADSNTHPQSPFTPRARTTGIIIQEAEEAWRKRNLLSLNGNGTHLYWSLLVLQKLMSLIKQEEEEQVLSTQRPWSTGFPASPSTTYERELLESTEPALPCHYFDLICSASMGGFIALMLGKYRISIDACIILYKRMLKDTFARPISFSLTDVVSSKRARSAWDMTRAIKTLETLNRQETLVKTTPGTCAVFIAASFQMKNSLLEKRPYLIRSYDNFGTAPTNLLQDSIPINFGRASGLDTSEAMQAATASPDFPKEISLDLTPFKSTSSIYLSDVGNISSRQLISLARQELQLLHGTECLGIIVSVTWRPELGTMLSCDRFWQFSDSDGKDGVNVKQDEWKISGFATKEYQLGASKTLAKVHTAFDKWVSQSTISARLQKCAQELVSRRRIRAIARERWEIFASGQTPPDTFKDKNKVNNARDVESATEESGSHQEYAVNVPGFYTFA